MYLQVNTFNDSSESGLAIQKVTARAGVSHGASLELFYQAENKEVIIRELSGAEVQICSTGKLSLTIKVALCQFEGIKRALDTLKAANFISEALTTQISENFPNGMGGTLSISANFRNRSYSIADLSLDVGASRQIETDWFDIPRPLYLHSYVGGVHSGLSSAAPSASSFPTDVSLQRFARTQWLKGHGRHPTTRQAFELTALQSDAELTTKINEFVQNAGSSTLSLKNKP